MTWFILGLGLPLAPGFFMLQCPPLIPMEKPTVSFKEFQQLELRTAEIIEVKPHPNADRLYVLGIKVGEERKQIVAGIRLHYSESELAGKKIVVVNNLEPAVIRGVESQGMLLAANDGDQVVLITPDRLVASGAQVR